MRHGGLAPRCEGLAEEGGCRWHHFQRRKLVRQREDLADQIAERLRPIYEHDFREVLDNERASALQAVVDELDGTELTDATLFAMDVDARKLARLVRERVPVRQVGLAERLYDAVLDESCMALVQVVKYLPAFEPRALAELLGRFSQVVEGSLGAPSVAAPRWMRRAVASTTRSSAPTTWDTSATHSTSWNSSASTCSATSHARWSASRT